MDDIDDALNAILEDADTDQFELTDIIDIEDLREINESFAASCKIASTLVDRDGNPITPPAHHSRVCRIIRSTPEGNARCLQSAESLGRKAVEHGRPYSGPCHAVGFIDACAPIVVQGKHLGNWLIGQASIGDVDEKRIADFAREIEADENDMLGAFREMANMPRDEFERKVDFLWLVTKQICDHAYEKLKLSRAVKLLHESQAELRRHQEGLEIIVQERTKQLKNAMEEIKQLSLTDKLTGAYNRRYITENLPREIQRTARYKRGLSVALLDIDFFKNINDTYGHQCGDAILQHIVQSVTASVRQGTDWIARFGGEEFLVVMPETDEKAAQGVCERIRHTIEEMRTEWNGKLLAVTVSFGVCSYDATRSSTSVKQEEMIRCADKALYAAKQKGRNTVVAVSVTGRDA